MPKGKKSKNKAVETLKHRDATRKNIPTAEAEPLIEPEQRSPLRVAYERRNRELDPQLVWRGKDAQDEAELVVNAPPLYIQEKVHPKALVDDLVRRTEADEKAAESQIDLFSDFNGLPDEHAKTEFYRHDANWSNRMILGDSLRVMASLAEREGLRGKVQCIYIDPPYGIRFNSNFQWSTTSRDVKDGKAEHITREPEQVKAFRDTWRDGIHSYLGYLRDRLTVARELLTESGSVFVQIGDENVHRVRAVMDEVFGSENFVSDIHFTKTSGFAGNTLSNISDSVLWYARSSQLLKYRPWWISKKAGIEGGTTYREVQQIEALRDSVFAPKSLGTLDQLMSQGSSARDEKLMLNGISYLPKSGLHWKTRTEGLNRIGMAGRLAARSSIPYYVRFLNDFAVYPTGNVWTDTSASFMADKMYVVQTTPKVIQRCILMTTDPGDLVLDPTCGSGTTAYVAEQWGRRWITMDTSRVSLALARARIMGARYPFYLLADSPEGKVKQAELSGTELAQSVTLFTTRRRHSAGLRLRARSPHYTEVHRQQRRNRHHLRALAA